MAACLRFPCPWARHGRELRVSLQQYPPTRSYHSITQSLGYFLFLTAAPRKDRGGYGFLLVEEARAQPRTTWEAGSSARMLPKDGNLPGREEAALLHSCTSLDFLRGENPKETQQYFSGMPRLKLTCSKQAKKRGEWEQAVGWWQGCTPPPSTKHIHTAFSHSTEPCSVRVPQPGLGPPNS